MSKILKQQKESSKIHSPKQQIILHQPNMSYALITYVVKLATIIDLCDVISET